MSILKASLTLIGMRKGTFFPLSFLDLTLSADFLSKISKKFGGENWHQSSKEGGGLRTPTANHQSFYGDSISSLIKNFCLKNVWKFLIKNQLTKSDPKRTRGWKVPCLMPIRVKTLKAFQHLGHLDVCSFSWNLLSIRGFF